VDQAEVFDVFVAGEAARVRIQKDRLDVVALGVFLRTMALPETANHKNLESLLTLGQRRRTLLAHPNRLTYGTNNLNA
jgi:hypothetical protein